MSILTCSGTKGEPKPDIYLADKLHMNEKGYAIWKQVVGEHLKSVVQTGTTRKK